jgi:hypothetical protein
MTSSVNSNQPNRQDNLEPKFPLGQLTATPGALTCLENAGVSIFELAARHLVGDWGEDLDPHDRQANEDGLMYGYRVMSAYRVGDARIWAITEADRSVTTFLLPSEY